MNAYHYTPKYRAPSHGLIPDGFELIERGTLGHFPLRDDLPHGETKHGVVQYRRPLSVDEQDRSELVPV